MSATVVIPARYGSTRFAAKILASETGRPLVQHVVDQVGRCKNVRRVIVATDDIRIVDALKPFGTECIMTSRDHPSGTDRIAEIARDLNDEIIINVQGDEPEIEPEIVDSLVDRLEQKSEDMVTAATPFPVGADATNPNLVKVVIGTEGRAMYFSRAPIPFRREGDAWDNAPYHLHLGIYGYRRSFLLRYVTWPQTPCEKTEKLEQLRALEHGVPIFVLVVTRATHGVDTPEQYAAFVQRFKDKVKRA